MKPPNSDVFSLDAGNYNSKMAKVRSSLTWLVRLSSSLNKSARHMVNVDNLFDSNGNLNHQAEEYIINGMPYRQLVLFIFAELPPGGGYDGIIQILCRHGMYFLRDEDSVLTSEMLETNPVCMDAHLHLIDMMMMALSRKIWATIVNVVSSVRKISTFSASKELPNDIEDCIVLWLGKITAKVQQLEQASEPHKRSVGTPRTFPIVSHKLDDLCDSCVLSVMLHYYCPQDITLDDIVLNDMMSIADAMHNLHISLKLCYKKFYPYHKMDDMSHFLTPEDFIQCSENMRPNFIAFYAFLFYCLEAKPIPVDNHTGNETIQSLNITSEHHSHGANMTLDGSSPRSESRISSVLPDVKSLISEATKRSFLKNVNQANTTSATNGNNISNLTTTCSVSNPDIASKLSFVGIPQTPLLPRRHEERPHSHAAIRHYTEFPVRKSTSLHDVNDEENETVCKWKTKIQPFSIPLNDENEESHYSRATKISQKFPISSTSLLSRVEVDDDINVDDIMSGRTRDSEELSIANSTDLAWSGFAQGRFNRFNHLLSDDVVSTSSSLNADDMKLETVRTADYRSPISTSRGNFNARPLTNSGNWVGDSSSDLTTVTTEFGASGDASYSDSQLTNHNSPKSVQVSGKSPEKSHRSNPSESTNSSILIKPLQTSYIAHNQIFNTADSARAAGYPVISQSLRSSENLRKLENEKNKTRHHEVDQSFNACPSESKGFRKTTLATSPIRTSASFNATQKYKSNTSKPPSEDSTKNQARRNCRWNNIAQENQAKRNEKVKEKFNYSDQETAELRHQLEAVKDEYRKLKECCDEKDANYVKLLHQMETLKLESQQVKENNSWQNEHFKIIEKRNKKLLKEESSSDYSSKSPSPSTSSRNDADSNEPVSVKPLNQQLMLLQQEAEYSDEDSTLPNENDTVIFVQKNLEHLKHSVEMERTKCKESSQVEQNKTFTTTAGMMRGSTLMPHPCRDVRKEEYTEQPCDTQPMISVKPPTPFNKLTSADDGVSSDAKDITHAVESSSGTQIRRTLFPSNQNSEHAPHEISVSYDSFSCQLKASSCHSTPSKSPPAAAANTGDNTINTQEDEEDRKATGFTIVDDKSPASILAKKKEQFLLGRLKKEEEHRRKQMEREAEAEKRKTEAREQQEKILQKKQEEKEKRDKRLKDYQKRKQQEEDSHHKPGVIGSNSGSSKKNPKSKANSQHNDQLDSIKPIELPSTSSFGLTIPLTPLNMRHPHGSHVRDEDADSLGSAGGSEYTGPKLYKQLSAKSNRTLINNALHHCCLSGKVNQPLRNKTLQAVEQSDACHLMVLFRDSKCQFRAVYSYHPDEEKLYKICGNGPNVIVPSMIESLFKYNSGRRSFICVPSKTLSVSIDAVTIKNSLWQHHHVSAKK